MPPVYGDSSDPLGGQAKAGGQVLTIDAFNSTLVGDAPSLAGHARGGADTLYGSGNLGVGIVIGDAQEIVGHARGGDDQVTAVGRSSAYAYGDALTIAEHGQGGNDVVLAGSRFGSFAYGDAELLTDFSRGGDDTLTASTDVFIQPRLFGDGDTLEGNARGGNDLLTAQDGPQSFVMYGDARLLSDKARAGNDTLVSGLGADTMWGDGAAQGSGVKTGDDVFVFAPLNGHDQVMDYEPGKDHIDLSAFAFGNFADLSSHILNTADGVLISFDGNNDILLRGVTAAQLNASDFTLG